MRRVTDVVQARVVSVIQELAAALTALGFAEVPEAGSALGVALLLKRQNWNTNRAVVVASLAEAPLDFGAYLHQLRLSVAKRCGYIPILWPIGIQFMIFAPGMPGVDPSPYLAIIDNQWAITQSIFMVDAARGEYRAARTWGQVITGRFQDAILGVLARHFRDVAAR
jgi:acyl-homoserine lactone acylase PvdQ